MMALHALGKDISWDQVNKETQYKNKLYTWSIAGALVLDKHVKGIKLISALDYGEFAKEGEKYLKRIWKSEWFNLQIQHASPGFQKEHKLAKTLVTKTFFEFKRLLLRDIEKLLNSYLFIALIDAGKLAGKNKSSGHFVFVYNQDSNTFLLHDPGLPPKKRWRVKKELFMASFKNELIAVPRQSTPHEQTKKP
ncbi:MAG: cysteine peptidase family C39 domain-containing protein [Patescibacteria group bacterium]